MESSQMSDLIPNGVDVIKDARALYEAIKKNAKKEEKVKNLDKLWMILNEIRENGERDFSLAEIGRRLEHLGGMKTQSLRNEQGVDYRNIIQAYANAINGSTRYISKNRSNIEEVLSLINDPSIRATIKMAIDEAKRLKVINDNLHAAFKNIQVGSNLIQNNKNESLEEKIKYSEKKILSFQFVQALRKGIDEKRLAQQGLNIENNGSITNEHGDTVFPPSFVFAIREILK